MSSARPPKGRKPKERSSPALSGLVQAAERMVEQGNFSQAETLARQTLREAPGHPGALAVLGILAVERDDFGTGVAHLESALAGGHRSAPAYRYLGYARTKTGNPDLALEAFRRGIELEPRDPAMASNLASALMTGAHWEEARTWAVRALELQPEFPFARFNLALLDLQAGHFQPGWEGFEARWELPGRHRPPFSRGLWGGVPVPGKHLLLYPDQGLEDTLMFSRLVRRIAEAGMAVHLVVQPEVRDLFSHWTWLASLHSGGEALPEFDLHGSLSSLPRLFKLGEGSIPWNGPYLAPPPSVPGRAELDRALGTRIGRRVGLIWRDPFAAAPNPFQSLPMELLRPLEKVPGVAWFGLSPGAAGLPPLAGMADLHPLLRDYGALAHALGSLDLLVSTDTPAAHLAGALGIPTLLLLHANSDWRWMLRRKDSPWYPGHCLLRQGRYGDWSGPVAAAVQHFQT